MTTTIPQIPLRDFFKNPEKTNFQISPDGQHISYMAPYNDRMNIFVQNRNSGETKRVTAVEDRSIMDYLWGSAAVILYLKDDGGDENFHLYAANLNGGEVRGLTPFPGVKCNIIDELPDNEQEILISLNKNNPQFFDVYRLNILTGDMHPIAENPGNIVSWLSDNNGRLRVAITTDGVNQQMLYRKDEDQPFEQITDYSFKDTFHPVIFDFDDQHLIVVTNVGRDKSVLTLFDPETKKEVKELYAHPEVDISGCVHSHKRKCITGAYFQTWKTEIDYFDAEAQADYDSIMAQLPPDLSAFIISKDKEEQHFLVRASSDRSLGSYYLYDKPKQTLQKIADISPWLNADSLSEMKPISYTSRDGLLIHGYLTLPKGCNAQNLPVVVNPHGGPWHRDVWGFNPEIQFLANRGYAVFQMNFRGSTGYGRKFWEASFKQWGLAMQDDITDGVQWLIDQGIADPKRIAIYGGSYGGYATLAGITFTPDLYCCAVDFVGVSNLFTFINTIPPYWKPMIEMMYQMVGDPETDKEQLTATSPVFHADRITAPLFVAQGAKDPRVNIDESDQIVNTLRKKGVSVQYMVKENEGHGFYNQENRFDFYEALESFFAQYLTAK